MSIIDDNMDWISHLPEGWHALYRQLVADIAELDGNIRVVQAKQKFGELRVYVDRHDDRVYALKRAASTASKAMCEQCGAAGQVTHRLSLGRAATATGVRRVSGSEASL